MEHPALICKGELLLNLRYIRNTTTSRREPEPVNYCLDCGISETQIWLCHSRSRVNYYLIYSTSETARVRQAHPNPVNYCLDYRTSETVIRAKGYLFGWTTTWITVPPKHHSVRLLCNVWWTTTWITVHPKPNTNISRNLIGELLLDLRCLRNAMTRRIRFPVGELLLDLRYFRDSSWLAPECARVNYCLDYCTSEIPVPTDALPARVNYCLIYGTSKTLVGHYRETKVVNYYLDYGTSETSLRSLIDWPMVNYYLDYRTSETEQ